jgi:superfamily II helicase
MTEKQQPNILKYGSSKLRGTERPSKIFTKLNIESIYHLEKDSQLLRKLNFIMNVILFNGAYSEKNLEQRISQMKKLRVPQWEQDILQDATDVNSKLSHKIFDELAQLIKEINIINKW